MHSTILNISKILCIMNTVVSRKENVFFPVKCVISEGRGGWPSVRKCEMGGGGGGNPPKRCDIIFEHSLIALS